MVMSKPIACSRMYNLSPRIRGLWDALFALVSLRSGVELEIIAHAAPAPLSALWSRPDMGTVFMCGYPFSRMPEDTRPAVLAAPVSSEAWSLDQPLYASHILVASTGPVNAVADLAAARWGWTVRDSQSGYHAARSYLADRFAGTMKQSTTVGPLLNPSGIVAALRMAGSMRARSTPMPSNCCRCTSATRSMAFVFWRRPIRFPRRYWLPRRHCPRTSPQHYSKAS